MLANKEDMLFERDEDGNLMPKVVILDLPTKDKIKILPLTRAGIKKIFSETETTLEEVDKDGEIILKKCIEPKFTEEEVKFLKPYYVGAIIKAIFLASGLIPPQKDETTKDSVQQTEEELKKNLVQEVEKKD